MANILVVDDHATNRELIVTLLGYKGHRSVEAADGAEALALVRSERPDLVICDIVMPTMDGYEFVRQLRADPDIAPTEVMFYSAYYREQEARNLARDCGVSHVLIKPCEPDEILRVVDLALAHKSGPAPAPLTQAFDREHLRLLTDKLSDKVQKLQHANQRLSALTDLNLQLASEREPHVLLDTVCRVARDLIGAGYAVLGVKAKNNGVEQYFTTSGIDAGVVRDRPHPAFDQGVLGQVLSERKARRLTNRGGTAEAVGLPAGYPAAHSTLACPITSLEYVYGWICLVNKLGAEEFSEEDERLLTILAAQMGRIYENGSLYVKLKRHAAELLVSQSMLQEREAALRHAQLMAKLGHVITRLDGSFESWSENLPQLIGLDSTQLPKSTRDWLEIVHPDDRVAFRKTAIDAAVAGADTDIEYRLRHADGTWIHIWQVIEPIREQAEAGGGQRWFSTLQDITEQRRAEQELRESERRFSDMLGKVELVSLMLNRDAQITYCNDYLLRLTGWRREEVFGRNWFELFIPPDLHDARESFSALLDDLPGAWHYENEILTRAGDRRLIRWNNSVLRSVSGEVIGTASIGEDITDRRQQEEKISRLNRVYAVLSGINATIVRVRDRDELFREACRIAVEDGRFRLAWIGIVDRDARQVKPVARCGVGEDYLNLIPLGLDETTSTTYGLPGRVVIERKAIVVDDMAADTRVKRGAEAGQRGLHSLAIFPLEVANEVDALLALYAGETGFFDEEEMKLLRELAGDIAFALENIARQARLDYLGLYDPLTGLPNRNMFHERLTQHVKDAAAARSQLAVILLDVESFNHVNNTLGRQAGDELLKQFAERSESTSPHPGRIARLVGDQFAVLIPDVRNADALARLLEKRIDEIFGPSFHASGTDLRLMGKFGIAMFPGDGTDAESLLRNAEAALKRAKATGERYLFYTQQMTERVASRLAMENELRHGLEKKEFVLHYQPKVDVETRRIVGAEALLRWQCADRGIVPPLAFIPLLEETGMILDVGAWALHRANWDYRNWLSGNPNAPRIAVNVSAVQLRHRNFVEVIRDLPTSASGAAGIDIEITESVLMDDIESNVPKLRAIRDLGVNIAIDDFGTGYSSLGYLAKLPVHSLKIDRSFIDNMVDEPDTLTLVSTIIALAHSLRLKVVAEGVETEEQAEILRLLRCDEIQGYLISHPIPESEFAALQQPAAR